MNALAPVLILFMLLGGLAVLAFRETPVRSPLTNIDEDSTATAPPQAPINPLSIEAARQKDYDGRDLTLGSVLDDNAAYTRYYVTYKSGSLTISGIMNIPKGRGPFPVIITNHGYIDPAVYTNGRGLKREQDYLARQGLAVLHPDYRCHADSDCPATTTLGQRLGYVEDVINAVKAVLGSSDSRLDKNKIGLLGHSMGGGIAQSIAVINNDIDAFVLFAPVSADQVDSYNKWLKERPGVIEEVRAAYGDPEENPRFWQEISPLNYFEDVKAPIQIHHGTADESVPLEWSQRTEQRLKELGKAGELFIYPGQPHEFTSAWGLVMQRTSNFFKTNLQ